jgi:hypothetical protein
VTVTFCNKVTYVCLRTFGAARRAAPSPLYDRRMPAGMRGSDYHPMHLTRRQCEIGHLWAARQASL